MMPAVDLQLGDRADPETDAERPHPQQVSREPGDRIEEVVLIVDAAFDQDEAGPTVSGSSVTSGRCCAEPEPAGGEQDDEGRADACRSVERSSGEPVHRTTAGQNSRRLSSSIVTGPSLTDRRPCGPGTRPVSTGQPDSRSAPTSSLYSASANGGGAAASNDGRRPFRQSRVQRELRHHQHRSPAFDDRAIHAAVLRRGKSAVSRTLPAIYATSAGPSSPATPAKTSRPAPMRPVTRPSTRDARRA